MLTLHLKLIKNSRALSDLQLQQKNGSQQLIPVLDTEKQLLALPFQLTSPLFLKLFHLVYSLSCSDLDLQYLLNCLN